MTQSVLKCNNINMERLFTSANETSAIKINLVNPSQIEWDVRNSGFVVNVANISGYGDVVNEFLKELRTVTTHGLFVKEFKYDIVHLYNDEYMLVITDVAYQGASLNDVKVLMYVLTERIVSITWGR